jgi:electron transfer flavoprotein alpha subunit
MSELTGVLVVGEMHRGDITLTTRELLGGAKRLADAGAGVVSLLLVGEDASSGAAQGAAFGADKAYLARDPSSSMFPYDFAVQAICSLCRDLHVSVCLMGQTDVGRDAAPRVAARLGGSLAVDCIAIAFDNATGRFMLTRPVYGGKAMAEVDSVPGILQVATVRQKSLVPMEAEAGRKNEVVDLREGPCGSLRTKLIDRKTEEGGGASLENARVIVAGGGGITGKEGFQLIEELSRLLKGVPGASRVPVDEGWVPHSMEIGQTGKIVSPEIYVAVGISGATQHITGMLGSKCIVAINKDPEANIFKVSDLGAVADYRELLPTMIEYLKKEGR